MRQLAQLLRDPELSLAKTDDHIALRRGIQVGIAVALEDGLITPVIFDADRKRMSEISREAKELAGRGFPVALGARRDAAAEPRRHQRRYRVDHDQIDGVAADVRPPE